MVFDKYIITKQEGGYSLIDKVYKLEIASGLSSDDAELLVYMLNHQHDLIHKLNNKIRSMKEPKEDKYCNGSGSLSVHDLIDELLILDDNGYADRIVYVSYDYDTHRNSIKKPLEFELDNDSVTFKGW